MEMGVRGLGLGDSWQKIEISGVPNAISGDLFTSDQTDLIGLSITCRLAWMQRLADKRAVGAIITSPGN
ncbi:hypothetical protein GCM10007854_05820 [Algimonas porphyrae]|uniref:Uncharacterized protein n=1 Tax=Algimonas porphyrae TaxID=1128113 RepID=A0ABQ5V048_9PROT|nr:hypothetical protein GCM10007854_05820 [Algimonas porphyrae]